MTRYRVRREPRREIVTIRGLKLQLTRWGPRAPPGQAPVVLLHGWQDTADTFQFMVDAFERDWPLVALDWRGFGRSEWPQEGYWFADYFADLEALLDLVAPGLPAPLVAHSMGGNVASQYAGLRPERVRCLANLEGFGLPRARAEDAPRVLRKWLDEVKTRPALKDYDSVEQLARVIRTRYVRFTDAQAQFIAAAWSSVEGHRVQLIGDSRHRWSNPVRYRREDAEACWRQMTAPHLLLLGDLSEYLPKLGADGTDAAFRLIFPGVEIAHVTDAGHMLHIERAERVAGLVEDFLRAH